MKIAIGSDHAGFEMKTYLAEAIELEGHDIIDCGTFSSESSDYPDYAVSACGKVQNGEARFAVLVCGTGIGISIAANKMRGIRAARCTTGFDAMMARRHNNANVLAIGGGVVGKLLARSIVKTFLVEEFTGEARHQRRIGKITKMENISIESGGLDEPVC